VFFCTFPADAVAELGIGMFMDIGFHLLPVAFVITDFFAVHADGQQVFDRFHKADIFQFVLVNHMIAGQFGNRNNVCPVACQQIEMEILVRNMAITNSSPGKIRYFLFIIPF
jgi:hypothetical protein